MDFSIVVATDKNNGIGLKRNNKYSIPWKSRDDMIFFKNLTSKKNSAIIVGRNTYFTFPKNKDSIPILKNRLNIVLTSHPELIPKHKDIVSCKTLDLALEHCKSIVQIDNVFVIGGVGVYKEALENKYLKYI